METKKFEPNLEMIAIRSKIEPFGGAVKHNKDGLLPEIVEMSFTKYTTSVKVETQSEDVVGAYQPSQALSFSTSTVLESMYKTVRITNIPINIDTSGLLQILYKEVPSLLFTRVHLAYDRDTHISKGTAYVSCTTEENAKEFARIARNIVVDSFRLCVEVIAN